MWRWRIRKDREEWRVNRVTTYGWVQHSETFPSWGLACDWARRDFDGLRKHIVAVERRRQLLQSGFSVPPLRGPGKYR
jgi:hypothetical protein